MRKKLLYTALLGAVLTLAVAVLGAVADDSVPLKGKDTFSASIVGGSGSTVDTADAGSGTLAHLGRFTMAASEAVDFATSSVANGAFVLTAANGDTLRGTYGGTILPGLVGYRVTGPITGGTGRFAGATGSIVFDGTFDPATDTGSDVISGSISTVGSA
jgi:hypothetical protein